MPIKNEDMIRTHLVISCKIICMDSKNNKQYNGKINFIDLAGSERIKKSGATGQALKEAMNINKSLSSLRDVLNALYENDRFIPYRNSTLTDILQNDINKENGDVLLYLNVCPGNRYSFETISTMKFGQNITFNIN